MAIKTNIEVFAKSDVVLTFTIDEDITGWALALVLSDQVQDATPLLTQAATVVNGPSGLCTVPLTALQTALAPGVYDYELARTNAGAADVFANGKLSIKPRVTS
jgi:hypothetical protein